MAKKTTKPSVKYASEASKAPGGVGVLTGKNASGTSYQPKATTKLASREKRHTSSILKKGLKK